MGGGGGTVRGVPRGTFEGMHDATCSPPSPSNATRASACFAPKKPERRATDIAYLPRHHTGSAGAPWPGGGIPSRTRPRAFEIHRRDVRPRPEAVAPVPAVV